MIKKTFMIVCSLALMLTLSSCGKYGEFTEELDALKVENSFPTAVGGATEVEETVESIRQQQVSLSLAYNEAKKITDTELFVEVYDGISPDRMASELSKTRNRINNENNECFRQNLMVILENVNDCSNVEAYIEKRIEEVKGFYLQYIELQNLDENSFEEVTSIFVSHANGKNEFAKWALKQKEIMVAESATRSIEQNSNVVVGHSAKLQKNNEIVTALNVLFGGVRGDTDHMERIKTSNKKLSSYVAKVTNTREKQLEELETQG